MAPPPQKDPQEALQYARRKPPEQHDTPQQPVTGRSANRRVATHRQAKGKCARFRESKSEWAGVSVRKRDSEREASKGPHGRLQQRAQGSGGARRDVTPPEAAMNLQR